ncbi:aminotransferase class I/II-fold pyridoxal phosphate-dependent enzyme [Emticicia sp.]|uniref:aminotransferase class I/II-fold pyridoxal phosphate-dependent enzyme n=1 Tax=Emticicia sp. TaxID=1930953 RepID=UPI0037511FD8
MSERIWLSLPQMGGGEKKYIDKAFDDNYVAPLGPNVDGFEQDLCQFTGSKYAAALSSGTAALHLALILAGVERGDEVICQSFTFSASANPIVYQGATPIFVDSEADTWNICPDALETAIKDRLAKGKKVKAVILVYLYGMPAIINEIIEICSKYNISLIEDAAEALGSTYNGKALGTFGKFGVLSFNGNKIITTSGGGALISDDEAMIQKARNLSTQARDPAPHYQHSQIGYNYRMSNICAGIGRGQMEVINSRVEQRRKVYDYYVKNLGNVEGISFQPQAIGNFSNRWLTAILLNSKKIKQSYDEIRVSLEQKNIETRPLWKPMHLQPIFKDAPFYGSGLSEQYFNSGLCLPSSSSLTELELESVVSNFIKKLNH